MASVNGTIGGALVLSLLAGGALAQQADGVAAFYEGKTLSIYIGSDVGGGFNAYARTVWSNMAQYIPGTPRVIFLNMPGSGGRKATGYIDAVAPKDGIAVGAGQPGALVESVLGDPKNAKYDARSFGYIGSAESSVYMCLARKDAPVKKLEDAFHTELVIGGDSKGSSLTDISNIIKNVLGLKFKVINGYKGSRAAALALERGEVQGMCGYGWSPLMSQAGHLVTEGKVNLLVQFALEGYEEPTRMGVPMIWKFVKNDEQRQVFELATGQQVFGRPYFFPAGVPRERLIAMRRAFDKTMKDPKYLAEAKRQKLEVTPASGEKVEETINRIFGAPKELAAKARAALYNE